MTAEKLARRRGTISRQRRRSSRGAVAVEFALIVPILLVLVLGLIQYGLYFWAMQGGAAAAREGARRAAVGEYPACSAFSTYVGGQITMATNTPTITKTYADPSGVARSSPSSVSVGDTVTVTVNFNSFDFHLPVVPFINNGAVTQKASARVEYIAPSPPALEFC